MRQSDECAAASQDQEIKQRLLLGVQSCRGRQRCRALNQRAHRGRAAAARGSAGEAQQRAPMLACAARLPIWGAHCRYMAVLHLCPHGFLLEEQTSNRDAPSRSSAGSSSSLCSTSLATEAFRRVSITFSTARTPGEAFQHSEEAWAQVQSAVASNSRTEHPMLAGVANFRVGRDPVRCCRQNHRKTGQRL